MAFVSTRSGRASGETYAKDGRLSDAALSGAARRLNSPVNNAAKRGNEHG
jgi:hypothetical protein